MPLVTKYFEEHIRLTYRLFVNYLGVIARANRVIIT